MYPNLWHSLRLLALLRCSQPSRRLDTSSSNACLVRPQSLQESCAQRAWFEQAVGVGTLRLPRGCGHMDCLTAACTSSTALRHDPLLWWTLCDFAFPVVQGHNTLRGSRAHLSAVYTTPSTYSFSYVFVPTATCFIIS